ncbi:MAG: HPr family phosphocarrier protein [Nanoarchaeota archaeon]
MLDIKEQSDFYEASCIVRIEEGLHARPCMGVVNLLQDYPNEFYVAKEIDGQRDEYVDGKSVTELLLLKATQDSKLYFFFNRHPKEVKIEQVREILVGLERLMNNKYA